MGVGVESEVGESEGPQQNERASPRVGMMESWGRWRFFGKTCRGDGD